MKFWRSEQERYKNTISPQGKNLLMCTDCISCTGHWKEKGPELKLSPGRSSAGTPGCSIPLLPLLPTPCWLQKGTSLPATALGLQRQQQEGLGSALPVWESAAAPGIPVPSCLCASPSPKTPSSCGRALLIVPQKHTEGLSNPIHFILLVNKQHRKELWKNLLSVFTSKSL